MPCLRYKPQQHNRAPVGEFPTRDSRLSKIRIYIVRPLRKSRGCFSLLKIFDRFTCFSVAEPIQNITAATVTQSLVDQWISFLWVSCHDTDKWGAQFESILLNEITELLSTCRLRTALYKLQSNGMVEPQHCTLSFMA